MLLLARGVCPRLRASCSSTARDRLRGVSGETFRDAPVVDVDPAEERLVIFSDHHKGARDGADDFAGCEENYAAALGYYDRAPLPAAASRHHEPFREPANVAERARSRFRSGFPPVGATGFEPATARPPADAHPCY